MIARIRTGGIILKIQPAYADIHVQVRYALGARGRLWIIVRRNTGGGTVRGSISGFGKGWENPSASIVAFPKKPQGKTAIPVSMPMPEGTETAAKKKPFVWYSRKGANPTALRISFITRRTFQCFRACV